MTTVCFVRSGMNYRAEIYGHAEYAPSGPDIVCASCSILAYTLLQRLYELKDARKVMRIVTYPENGNFTSGEFFVRWIACDRIESERLIETIAAGYRLLSNQYPGNVEIKEKAVG